MQKQAAYTTAPVAPADGQADDATYSERGQRCLIYEDGRYTWGELPDGIGFRTTVVITDPITEIVTMRPGAAWYHSTTHRVGGYGGTAIVFHAFDHDADLPWAAVLDGPPVAFRHTCFLNDWLVRVIRDYQIIDTADRERGRVKCR